MGKIVVAMYLTLDGVMESPSWTMPYWEDSLAAYQAGAQENAEALLLGRVTFEQFAGAWPNMKEEGASFMNGCVKYVPTTTLRQPQWNGVYIRHKAMDEIRKLREEHNLLVYGSGELVRGLFREGLVDEYREMVFPLLLGSGKRLFDNQGRPFSFKKVHSSLTEKGVLLNTYTV